jgi:septal ring factor EnvC (AmiA/AmiB activator)
LALARAASSARAASEPPVGLAQKRGRLTRPVSGGITSAFGTHRADDNLAFSRRGVELEAARGEPVHAIAAGQIRWVGEVPGFGRGVAIDHGDGYVSLTARLSSLSVATDTPVQAGAVLGRSLGPSVYFELTQAGTPLDPARWIRP